MFSFPFFAAHRLARSVRSDGHTGKTSPLLRLSILGVALSLCVMLVSIAIILGFKRQVSAFAYSQTGHISLYPWGEHWLGTQKHFGLTSQLRAYLEQSPLVADFYPVMQRTALLKTQSSYTGLLLYGVDSAFAHPYFVERLHSGAFPSFSSLDSVAQPLVLSSKIAEQMGCRVGDRVHLYFLGDRIQVRAYTLAAIYESSGLDKLPALCAASSLRRLDKLASDRYNRVLLMTPEGLSSTEASTRLAQDLELHSELLEGESLGLSSAEELMPDLFNWLSLLDSNVYLLLVLMVLVSGFTMITGLIITVLDKTRQIGLLKALGARDGQIRTIFALIASRLMLRALLWGNLLAGMFCWVQIEFRPMRLDPRNYFVDAVPVAVDPWLWIGVNVGAAVLIMLMILGPTRIVGSIRPASVMRFD